jgi:hypothetical protein
MSGAVFTIRALLAAVPLSLGLALIAPARVAACDCTSMAPGEAARASQIAFTGTVTNIAEAAPEERFEGGPTTLFDFAVDGVAKGEVASDSLSLWAGGDGAACGISFNLGERWLIFASVAEIGLSTHLCAGNVQLGPDEVPPLPVSAPPVHGTEASSGPPVGVLLAAAVLLAAVALAVFLFWRAERRPS